MSEFTCKQGHLIRPSIGRCEICGGGVAKMDGLSDGERWARERFEAHSNEDYWDDKPSKAELEEEKEEEDEDGSG